MSEQRIERIRQPAHEIWRREGKPDGREHEHWQMAVAETEAEEVQGVIDVPAGPAAKPSHSEGASPLQKDGPSTGSAMSRVAGPGESKQDRPLRGAGGSGQQDK